MDTGVAEGGEIPMFYDSMIAKLIVHGRSRAEAIAGMREALDGFAIRGVSSNIPLQAALLAHPAFVAGDFNTGFIARHYPQGLEADGAAPSTLLLAVVAAAHHGEASVHGEYVILVKRAQGLRDPARVSVRREGGRLLVEGAGGVSTIAFDGHLRDIVVRGSCDGKPFTVQLERAALDYRVAHNGASFTLRVVSPRVAELEARMPVRLVPDLASVLLSPMPGLLVDLPVQAGQVVRAGERLAAIEAMKMENVLFASRDGVVAEVCAKPGDSLAVDQVILRFR